MKRECSLCVSFGSTYDAERCKNCHDKDKWELAKCISKSISVCGDCKHWNVKLDKEPCISCENRDKWEPMEQPDSVNHPSHYEVNGYEAIEVMKAVFGEEAVKHFALLNAFKYLWRFSRKNGEEDIKKAKKYLEFYQEITQEEK